MKWHIYSMPVHSTLTTLLFGLQKNTRLQQCASQRLAMHVVYAQYKLKPGSEPPDIVESLFAVTDLSLSHHSNTN